MTNEATTPSGQPLGISHNPREYAPDADCVAGANVFLDVVSEMAGVR